MKHILKDELMDWAHGFVSEAQSRRIEKHLKKCRKCRNLAADMYKARQLEEDCGEVFPAGTQLPSDPAWHETFQKFLKGEK